MLNAEETMKAFVSKSQNSAQGVVIDQDDPNPPGLGALVAPRQLQPAGDSDYASSKEVTPQMLEYEQKRLIEDASPVARGFAKAEVPDMRQIVVDRCKLLGVVDSAIYFNRKPDTITKWLEGKTDNIGISDVTKALERPVTEVDRRAITLLGRANHAEGEFTLTRETPRLPIQVCCPVKGPMELPVVLGLVGMALKHSPYFRFQNETLLVRSRNLLADAFVRSGLPWSCWIDADVIVPLGSPWFKDICGPRKMGLNQLDADFLTKLTSYPGKLMVGAVYAARSPGQPMITQLDLSPRTMEDQTASEALRNGTGGNMGLIEVDWLAFGAVAVHRDVFLAVQERFKSECPVPEGEPFPFFSPITSRGESNLGEDICLAAKVRECGIKMWLDSSCVAGHVGKMVFLPEHGGPARRLS